MAGDSASRFDPCEGAHGRVPIRLAERFSLAGILLLAAFLRFYGLDERGMCTSDEGHYAHQAWQVLRGEADAIKDKPGHTGLIVLSFKAFGVRMTSPLYLSAAAGLVAVALVWWMVRGWCGPAASCLAALLASFLPYTLSYQRSALSDGPLFTCLLSGVLLFGRGMQSLVTPASCRSAALRFSLSGLVFGLALSINYSVATTLLPAVLALAAFSWRKRETWRTAASGLLGLSAGLGLGYGIVLAILWPFIEHAELWRQIRYHGNAFAQSNLSLRPLRMLSAHGGLLPMVLAGIGLVRMARRRGPLDVLGLFLAGFMAAAYARASQPYPRVYHPLCLPLLMAAASGFATVLGAWPRGQAAGPVVAGLLLLGCAGEQGSRVRALVTMRSGYQQAFDVLLTDELQKGGTTHTWWAFQAFTARPFGYCSKEMARKLGGKNWETDLLRLLLRWERQGYTHIVIDYFLWNEIDAAAPVGLEEFTRRLARFLELYRPAFRIENAAARDEQVLAEDGGLPAAGFDPHAEFIYILRLKDIRTAAEP
ncbi:MAG: glycosyltransferase family 39 protein [Planctomycetes bacterium]|nr:glycosyltransferase family 39 protein [Planctomycetota bacterium]